MKPRAGSSSKGHSILASGDCKSLQQLQSRSTATDLSLRRQALRGLPQVSTAWGRELNDPGREQSHVFPDCTIVL